MLNLNIRIKLNDENLAILATQLNLSKLPFYKESSILSTKISNVFLLKKFK